MIFSLGSNFGDRLANLKEAIILLAKDFNFIKVSSVYETSPVENTKQDYFYNCCVMFDKEIAPERQYYSHCKQVEKKMVAFHTARNESILQKQIPKGPRLIDIDIIFIDMKVIKEKDFIIPHPSFSKRLFVLVPLLEIAFDAIDPISQDFVSNYLEKNVFPKQVIKKCVEQIHLD